MKNYHRLMLGGGSKFAQECFAGGFIGTNFEIDQDFTGRLPETWREFNAAWRPIWLAQNPGKSKVAAGIVCALFHSVCKGIREGATALCPDGKGNYRIAEVTSPYSYHPSTILPHRRSVSWLPVEIARADMSPELRASTGAGGITANITKHAAEIEALLGGGAPPELIATDATIEDPVVFALEKHLEDFLVKNWVSTELGKRYDIFELEGDIVGQQYPSDTGAIDILAVSKDGGEILVVELKKGRASDAVVGQIQRYMGYMLDELAEEHQTVKGVIIALEDDLRIRRALKVAQNIDFYRYQINLTLLKG